MPQHGRTRDPELPQRATQKVGLGIRRPDRPTGTLAVAISRTVEDDDTVFLGCNVDQPARLEILDHASVTVQQDERISLSTFQVMEPHPIHFEKMSDRAISTLRRLGKLTVYDGRNAERPNRHGDCQCRSVAEQPGSSSLAERC